MNKEEDKEMSYPLTTDHLHPGGELLGSGGGLGRDKTMGGMSQRPSLLSFYQVSETRAQMLGFHYSLGPLPLHAADTATADNHAQKPGLGLAQGQGLAQTQAQKQGLAHSIIPRDVHVRLWTSRATACRHNATKILEVERLLQQEAAYQTGEGVSVDGYGYGYGQPGGVQENISASGYFQQQQQQQLVCHLPFASIAGGVGCIAGRGSVAVVHQIWSLLAASLELLALTLSMSLGE